MIVKPIVKPKPKSKGSKADVKNADAQARSNADVKNVAVRAYKRKSPRTSKGGSYKEEKYGLKNSGRIQMDMRAYLGMILLDIYTRIFVSHPGKQGKHLIAPT